MKQTNNIRLNRNKCHLLVSGHKYENVCIKLGDEKILKSTKPKLLGIKIGRNFKFDDRMISKK